MSIYVDIRKKFKDFELDICFEVDKESLGILGASGCGKSMTLKCISGIEKPDDGEIVLDGKVVYSSKAGIDIAPQKRNTGYLFQSYALFPNMTVGENISVGLRVNKFEKNKIVKENLKTFCLEGYANRYPAELSGGQQQRVALARILAHHPKILMLDEPFSALDSFLKWQLEQEMQNVLDNYNGNIIFVSHSRNEIYRNCDNVAILSSGKLDCFGSKYEIFKKPRTVEAAKLTGCKNISRAEKIDDTTILAIDWGIKLKVDKVDDNLKYIGIRSNLLKLAEKDVENVFQFKILKVIHSPFTINSILKLANSEGEGILNWEIEKSHWEYIVANKDLKFLSMPKNDILQLVEI